MPKIDIKTLPAKTGSGYPAPYAQMFEGRHQYQLGTAAGLTQFGANLVRLAPGAMSSLRHWHELQDEFLVVTEGALTLVDDHGETLMTPGDCAAFPAGDANGHHLINRTDAPGAFVVVGTKTPRETGWYSDVDMKVEVSDGQFDYTRRDGTPLAQPDSGFAEISDNLTKALVTADYDLYRDLFYLPVTIEPRNGRPYTLQTEEAFEEDFRLYASAMQLNHVTDIFRKVLWTQITKDGLERVHAQVDLISNAQRVVEPFEANFYLRDGADGLRLVRIESSIGHIHWTLGVARITENRFETE